MSINHSAKGDFFIKTHTKIYLQAWDKAFPGFLLSFSCHTQTRNFFSSSARDFSSVFRRLFLWDYFLGNFSSIGISIDFTQFSLLFTLFSLPADKFSFIYNFWAFKPKPNAFSDPVFYLLALRTFKLELKSCVEKSFASDSFWKILEVSEHAQFVCCWYFNDFSGVAEMREFSAMEIFFAPRHTSAFAHRSLYMR